MLGLKKRYQSTAAVIVCAGSSTRMGSKVNKLLAVIDDKPVAVHTLLAYQSCKLINEIIVVTKPELINKFKELSYRYNITKLKSVVAGADERSKSVINGVNACSKCIKYVAIADGARPLTIPQDIENTITAAQKYSAAALGEPVVDTIKRIDHKDMIIKTVRRDQLIKIQTPQVVKKDDYLVLASVAATLDKKFTDDVSILEHYNKPVKYIKATAQNYKITTANDLDLCEYILKSRREKG